MEYWQYKKKYTVTPDEFIQMARNLYSYEVPTFRQALSDLFRSLFRNRIINKAIPDLGEAIYFLEGREVLSVPRVDKPSEFEFRQYNGGARWMLAENLEVEAENEEEY